jgi:hypothetical protein
MIVPVILTFFTTTVIFLLIYFYYLDRSSTVSFADGTRWDQASKPISWDSASIFINDFKKSKALMVTHKGVDDLDPKTQDPLQGFTMNADHLRQILDTNRSGTNPDNVIFYFGEKGKTSILFGRGIINIFAVGVKDKVLLIDANKTTRLQSVFDHANPCPPFCPSDPSKTLH